MKEIKRNLFTENSRVSILARSSAEAEGAKAVSVQPFKQHRIVIETGIEMPTGRLRDGYGDLGIMRQALLQMQPGDSFVWTKNNKHPYLAAKQVRCKIISRKLPEGGWRIWRVE